MSCTDAHAVSLGTERPPDAGPASARVAAALAAPYATARQPSRRRMLPRQADSSIGDFSAGIPAKALRAVGVGVKSELSRKEKKIRAKLKAKLMREAVPSNEVYANSVCCPDLGCTPASHQSLKWEYLSAQKN